MKTLIFIIVIFGFLYSDEVNDNFSVSGKSVSYFCSIDQTLADNTKKHKTLYYSALQLNLDYDNGNFHFQATPYGYSSTTGDGKPIKNPVMYEPNDESYFFFRSLYMSYTIDKLTMGLGILPFSNSVPMKYSDNSFQDGVGLNTINDNDLTSLFFKYRTENSETIFGVGLMTDIIAPAGDYIGSKLKKGTDVYFLINTYNNDKWTITNELMFVDMKFEEKDISDIYLYGLGVSWDDTAESGLVLYNVAAGSIYDNNSMNAEAEIFDTLFEGKNPYKDFGVSNVDYGRGVAAKYPDSFAMDDGKKYYGASNLLGLRYEIDYFPMETFINFEWFHTFGDWSSGNQGNMYNAKINQTFNVRDDSFYVNYGIMTSKNSLLRFVYSYVEFDEFGKIGAPADTVKASEFLGGSVPIRKKLETVHVIFTYRF